MIVAHLTWRLPAPVSLDEARTQVESTAAAWMERPGLIRRHHILGDDPSTAVAFDLWTNREQAEAAYGARFRETLHELLGARDINVSFYDVVGVLSTADRSLHLPAAGEGEAPEDAQSMVEAARSRIEDIGCDQVRREIDAGATLVDLREPAEVESGRIPGAVHVPRGLLEFAADPSSPAHRRELDPARRTIVYCASGGRSALAGETLIRLGYRSVAHLDGGISAWAAAGEPLEAVS